MNRVQENPADADVEQRRRESLMLYTMLLIGGNRRMRTRIIDAGTAGGLTQKQIADDLRRYGMVEHAYGMEEHA